MEGALDRKVCAPTFGRKLRGPVLGRNLGDTGKWRVVALGVCEGESG